jgi:RHS repeat-associated protein
MTANDYYPFGMSMPNRKFDNEKYRYGFNGQEKSTEVNPEGTTAEFWQYDSRTGRRWNVDPKHERWESPYLCLGNNPIILIDPKGDRKKKGGGGWEQDKNNADNIISKKGDNINTLCWFLYNDMGIDVNWDRSDHVWQNGNYEGNDIHINQVWNIYVANGGNADGSNLNEGQIGILKSQIYSAVKQNRIRFKASNSYNGSIIATGGAYNFAKDAKRQEGKGNKLRGGAQGQRDHEKGNPKYPKAFWEWYHNPGVKKDYKLPGQPDPPVDQVYDDWINLGFPKINETMPLTPPNTNNFSLNKDQKEQVAVGVSTAVGIYIGIKVIELLIVGCTGGVAAPILAF